MKIVYDEQGRRRELADGQPLPNGWRVHAPVVLMDTMPSDVVERNKRMLEEAVMRHMDGKTNPGASFAAQVRGLGAVAVSDTQIDDAYTKMVSDLTNAHCAPGPIVAADTALSLGGGGGSSSGSSGSSGLLSEAWGGVKSIFGFASGGAVHGPGGSRDDSILARISNGEFVVNATAAHKHLSLLEAINNGGILQRFAMGGLVGGPAGGENGPEVTLSLGSGKRI